MTIKTILSTIIFVSSQVRNGEGQKELVSV